MSYATAFNKGQTVHSVSNEWHRRGDDERFLSLSDMLAFKRKLMDASTEEVFLPSMVRMATDIADPRALGFAFGDRMMTATNWSFGQLCRMVGAPARYLAKLPAPLAAAALQLHLNEQTEEVKTLSANGRVRAWTSESYGRIWDADVIEALMKVAGNGTGDARFKVPGSFRWETASYTQDGVSRAVYDPNVPVTKESTTLYASDRDMFTFLCDDKNPIEVGKLPDGSPDLMFRGMIVWNSEVGSRTLGVATMYLRGVCCNRILWGVEGYQERTLRHSSMAPAKFIESVVPAFASYAEDGTQKLVAGVKAAKAAVVAKDDEEAIDFLGKRLNFSQLMATKVIRTVEAEEGGHARTIWDMAQGITALARLEDHGDDRYDLELKARTLLDAVV